MRLRDLRKFEKQTRFRLVAGGLLLIIILGEILIYIFYGYNAALAGIVCMLVGLSPIIIVMIVLWGLEWIVHRWDNTDG